MQTAFQRALEETDLTDVELAFRIGVTVTTIWRWRTGRSVPSSHAIREAIAATLGRSTAELFAT